MSEAKITALGERLPAGYLQRIPKPPMNTAMTDLPDAVKRYLASTNECDADGVADCFTYNAYVHDENRDYFGKDAIRGWLTETSRKFQPKLTVVNAWTNRDAAHLAIAISGQFPGSPVTLDFHFQLREGKIAELSIE
jgi:hypothetical protein